MEEDLLFKVLDMLIIHMLEWDTLSIVIRVRTLYQSSFVLFILYYQNNIFGFHDSLSLGIKYYNIEIEFRVVFIGCFVREILIHFYKWEVNCTVDGYDR